jgi:signal transduction histidine kinase
VSSPARPSLDPRWGRAIRWLRWGALAFALLLVWAGQRPVGDEWLWAAGGLLVLVAAAAMLLERDRDVATPGWLVVETALATLAVVGSGGWDSPFGLYLAMPVLAATLRLGAAALLLPIAAVAVVALVGQARGEVLDPLEVLPLVLPLALTATLGLVGRLSLPSRAPQGGASGLGEMEELGYVNALLANLHRLVRSSPAPLTVEDVLGAVHSQVEEMFDPDAVVLLLEDADGRWWRSVDVPGTTPVGEVAYADLPADLLHAGEVVDPVLIPQLGQGGGLTAAARSGVYQWLFSRGRRAALLAIERNEPGEVPQAHLESLSRLAAPLALALDNAVWFSRLQTLGAEYERQRLGAQLHDRFAQSLAYVGLELDRAVSRHEDDPELVAVRDDVRETLSELRATLRDLRLRCTEDHGLAETLTGYLRRLGERFEFAVHLDVSDEFPRLALPVENHLLRAVQELIELLRSRAGATEVVVRLLADDERLRVVVRADGRGLDESQLDRDHAGVLAGVRERADAIGARLDLRSRPGEGAEVAMTVRRGT